MSEGPHKQAALPCGHTFGLQCAQSWLRDREHQYCPVCRTSCKLKQVVVLYNDQNEIIERLQAELKRQQEKVNQLETAQKNPPPPQPLPSIVAPLPPNKISAMDISEPELMSAAPAPPPRIAPAYFGLTNHSLPHFDAQLAECIPALDMIIVNSSRNITAAPQTTMIHPKKHEKIVSPTNYPFGVTLYRNWTSSQQFIAYYIPLAMDSINNIRVHTRDKGPCVKHFILVSTTAGNILALEIQNLLGGLEANIEVEISLGNARDPITALEWDVTNHDFIYAAVGAKILRMDLNMPESTTSWISSYDNAPINDRIFKLISVAPTADSMSNLIVGSSSGIYTIEWSYNNSIRSVEAETVAWDDKNWYVLQPHPLHPKVVLAGCCSLEGTEDVEEQFYSLALSDPRPDEYDLSPRLLLYRLVKGDALRLANSACFFTNRGRDYVLATEPLAALEITSISTAPAAPSDVNPLTASAKKLKVPMITPDHLAKLEKALHWKVIGTGDNIVIVVLDASRIQFLMPY